VIGSRYTSSPQRGTDGHLELLEKEHQEVRDLFQQFFGGGTITRLVNKVVGTKPRRARPWPAESATRSTSTLASRRRSSIPSARNG
jgi:hypothetical protein